MSEAQVRVLDFWRAVELLSPQKLPRPDPSNRDYPVVPADPDSPLPWHTPGWRDPLPEGKSRRFTLYGGAFDLSAFRSILVRKFGKDAQSFDRRRGGSSCLFAVQLTGGGRPLFHSLTVASCPWALSQTVSPGPQRRDWLDGFSQWSQSQRVQLERLWAVPEDDAEGLQLLAKHRVGRRLDHGDIAAGIATVASSLRVGRILNPRHGFIKAWTVSKERAFELVDFDFVNSFYIDDLARVAAEVKAGNAGTPLSRVLLPPGELNEAERIDVRQSHDAPWRQLAPDRFPRGRWPSPSVESPYFSQQFAINSAAGLGDTLTDGVLGVNGPPGSGKTTLLRELAASIVVKRAQALAALRRPSDAFDGEVTWKSERTRRISLWKPEFRGFEIVVASNNNRAVENVTLEIPSANAIDPEWTGAIDYFADFATRLQRGTRGGAAGWALVAARFGNKKNRKYFRDNFWYGEDDLENRDTRANLGFAEYLRSVKARPSSWKDAVRAFESALAAEERIRKLRCDAWAAANALREALAQLGRLEAHAAECRAAFDDAELQFSQAEKTHRRAEEVRDIAIARRRENQTFKPTLVDAVFTLGSAYRGWRNDDTAYANQASAAEAECAQAAANLASCADQRTAAQAACSAALRELSTARETAQSLQASGASDWPQDSEARELSSPWSTEEWNRARTAVFLKALQLHRAFIECSPQLFRRNLWAVIDLLSGKVPAGIDMASAESAWTTMFFVIPVLSTTFASFHRLFAHLGRESLGWLLIDEAGQTAPQAAAGAIWRSRRVVATGDPLQLEPIVNLPYTSQQALRKHFGVDEVWMPSQTSAQGLVDRASSYGTYLQSEIDGTQVWVGSPLRVHRRCERPMFDISNRIAYNGQMVYATPAQDAISLSPSRWLHVASGQAEGHWIPAEGLLVSLLLNDLRASGLYRDSVLLISPFRAVALKLRAIAKKFGFGRAGTIHVAQGTGADVVILVLGGNPASEAAREWASDRPNLLNVAVSRAKRRLYIVGNREHWGKLPYFSEAAELLKEASQSAAR